MVKHQNKLSCEKLDIVQNNEGTHIGAKAKGLATDILVKGYLFNFVTLNESFTGFCFILIFIIFIFKTDW